MSEAKFMTDWKLGEWIDDCTLSINAFNGRHHAHHSIAEVVVRMSGDVSGSKYNEKLKANAHLIAAAPKMYKMLYDLEGDYICNCGHPRCSKERQRKEILRLLAEARGES